MPSHPLSVCLGRRRCGHNRGSGRRRGKPVCSKTRFWSPPLPLLDNGVRQLDVSPVLLLLVAVFGEVYYFTKQLPLSLSHEREASIVTSLEDGRGVRMRKTKISTNDAACNLFEKYCILYVYVSLNTFKLDFNLYFLVQTLHCFLYCITFVYGILLRTVSSLWITGKKRKPR